MTTDTGPKESTTDKLEREDRERRRSADVAIATDDPKERTEAIRRGAVELANEETWDALQAWKALAGQADGGSGGVFAKVYKLGPLPADAKGEPIEVGTITNLLAVDDLSAEVIRCAAASGEFGRGRFRIVCFKPPGSGGRGREFANPRSVLVHVVVPGNPAPPASAAASVDPLSVVDRTIAVAKTLNPQGPATAPDPIAAVTAFADAVAKFSSAQSGPTKALLESAIPLLTKVVDRLLTPAAPAPPNESSRLHDILINRVLERALTEPPSAVSSLDQMIGTVNRLQQYFSPAGPTGAEPESTPVAIARILGPYIPQVLRTVDNIVDTARMRIITTPGPGGHPSSRVAVPPPPAAVQAFVAETQAAIAKDDHAYFPRLVQGIAEHMGGGPYLLQIQDGTLGEEQALAGIQGTGLFDVRQPAVRAYMLSCFHWLQKAKPFTAAANGATPGSRPEEWRQPDDGNGLSSGGEIIARCRDCGQEYRFADQQEYDEDTKLCDNMVGGTPDPSAPPGSGAMINQTLCSGTLVIP